VDPVTSVNRTVTVLRTSDAGAAATSAEPHRLQNRDPGAFSKPQLGHIGIGGSLRRASRLENRDA